MTSENIKKWEYEKTIKYWSGCLSKEEINKLKLINFDFYKQLREDGVPEDFLKPSSRKILKMLVRAYLLENNI
jgi:hypothetical protein